MTENRVTKIIAPVFFLACSLWSCVSTPLPEPVVGAEGLRTYGPALLEYSEGIPVITLSGSHYEMGRQYGILLRKEYAESIAKTKEILQAIEDGSPALIGPFIAGMFKAKVNKELLRSLPTKYRDELKGLSAGSGVSFDDVVFAAAAAGTIDLACTSIVSKKGDSVLLGRNLDWAPGFFGSMPVVVRFKPEGEKAYLSAGFLALPMGAFTAVGEGGIALAINIVGCHEEKESSGLPIYYLSRELLAKSDSLKDAADILGTYRGRESWLVSLSSGAEAAGGIMELTGTESNFERLEYEGSIYALNGFRGARMRKEYAPLLDPVTTINDDRSRLLDEILRTRDGGFVDGLLDILADDGSPTISESRWTGQGVNHNGTIQTAVLDPSARRIYIGYAPLYAGWSAVKTIDLEGGPARSYRPASPLASVAAYESIESWYPDFLLDLYGGHAGEIVGKIKSGGTITPISFTCLCQAFESDPSAADPAYLETALAALEKIPSEFLYAVMPAADYYFGVLDYERAESLYHRALLEESLLSDDRIRALSRLAVVGNRRGDAKETARFARECLALLDDFSGHYAFGDEERRLLAEMRKLASVVEGKGR